MTNKPDYLGFFRLGKFDDDPRYTYRNNQHVWELYHKSIRGSVTAKKRETIEQILALLQNDVKRGSKTRMPVRGAVTKPDDRKRREK